MESHGNAGAERLAGVLPQWTALDHFNICYNGIGPDGVKSFAGVLGQYTALTHLELGTITSARLGQRVLQECWGSAHRCLTSVSLAMTSALSGKGDFELRDVVNPLSLFWRRRCRYLRGGGACTACFLPSG